MLTKKKQILNAKKNFFFEKILFGFKIGFSVEEKYKKQVWGKFKIFVLLSKTASHTSYIYAICMRSNFSKNKNLRFFITRLFYYNQAAAEKKLSFFNQFSKMYETSRASSFSYS